MSHEQMTFDQVTDMEYIGAGGYEYGVIRDGDRPANLHRGPMTETEANDWVKEWKGMVDDRPSAQNMFKVVRRRVGEWHEVDLRV